MNSDLVVYSNSDIQGKQIVKVIVMVEIIAVSFLYYYIILCMRLYKIQSAFGGQKKEI